MVVLVILHYETTHCFAIPIVAHSTGVEPTKYRLTRCKLVSSKRVVAPAATPEWHEGGIAARFPFVAVLFGMPADGSAPPTEPPRSKRAPRALRLTLASDAATSIRSETKDFDDNKHGVLGCSSAEARQRVLDYLGAKVLRERPVLQALPPATARKRPTGAPTVAAGAGTSAAAAAATSAAGAAATAARKKPRPALDQAGGAAEEVAGAAARRQQEEVARRQQEMQAAGAAAWNRGGARRVGARARQPSQKNDP